MLPRIAEKGVPSMARKYYSVVGVKSAQEPYFLKVADGRGRVRVFDAFRL